MAKAFALSESDQACLRELLQAHRKAVANVPHRGQQDLDWTQTPDVYVILTPLGGIPGLVDPEIDPETGTGTGTGPASDKVRPGHATCDVFMVREDGNGNLCLFPTAAGTVEVFNLGDAIGEDEWELAVRDKFGTWWVSGSGAGGGGGGSAACDLATLKPALNCVLATGLGQSLLMEWGSIGSETPVWRSFDTFDYPEGSGFLELWFANGTLHLSLDGDELMSCGNNCWVGGPLTGHVEAVGTDCGSVTFEVCIACVACPGTGTGTSSTGTGTQYPNTGTGTGTKYPVGTGTVGTGNTNGCFTTVQSNILYAVVQGMGDMDGTNQLVNPGPLGGGGDTWSCDFGQVQGCNSGTAMAFRCNTLIDGAPAIFWDGTGLILGTYAGTIGQLPIVFNIPLMFLAACNGGNAMGPGTITIVN